MYNFTVEGLKKKFKEFNKRFFGGMLPEVNICIDHTRNRLGAFHHGDRHISISDYLRREEHSIDETLVHEMVHLWQWTVFHAADHGTTFKMKAAEISVLSNGEFKITRTADTFGDEARRSKKSRTELLLFDWRGRTYACRPCKGKGPELLKRYQKSLEVSNLKLVSAYGDFETWTRSSTRLHCTLDITQDVKGFRKTYKVKDVA